MPVDIFAGGTLTDEYARINPMRTVPVLETEEGYLPESNAILTYLANGTPFLPDDPWECAHVVRWLIYEQTDVVFMIGGLRFRLLVGRWTPDHPEAEKRRAGALEVLQLLDDHLAEREFLVGDRYTIADIAVFGYSHRAEEAGSTWRPTRASAPGSPASSRSQDSWRTSSRTALTPRPARGSRSTAERRALSAPGRGGTVGTRPASATRTRQRGRPSG